VKQCLNKVILDMVHLGWNDHCGEMQGSKSKNGDATLEKGEMNLFCALGYDESKELDVGVVPIKPGTMMMKFHLPIQLHVIILISD
jgi:hypothetical protein